MGVIAGGDTALRRSVENAEDNPAGGEAALRELHLTDRDFVVAISASGSAPYCLCLLYRSCPFISAAVFTAPQTGVFSGKRACTCLLYTSRCV